MTKRGPISELNTLIREMFFEDKCGLDDKQRFYTWCVESRNQSGTSECTLTGMQSVCKYTMQFQRLADNSHRFSYSYLCQLGGSKDKTMTGSNAVLLDEEDYESIGSQCAYQLYGPTLGGVPWWLVLLIAAVILAVLALAVYLFYKYWYKRRSVEERLRAQLGSMYTSGPVFGSGSSVSAPSAAITRTASSPRASSGAANLSSAAPSATVRRSSVRSGNSAASSAASSAAGRYASRRAGRSRR